MIIKRLVELIRQQHWTAVAIELMVVVVGVFIGLQVDNWNQSRHERVLEREYQTRMLADLRSTLAARPDEQAWAKERLETQALVINALRAGVLPEQDREKFDKGLLLMGYVAGPDVVWSTVEELQSTGSMTVIRDISLRTRIGRFDADLKRRKGISASLASSINAFRQQIGHRFAVVEFTDFAQPVRLAYDFHALAADPDFINTLTQIDALARMKLTTEEIVMEDVRKLIVELEQSLPAAGDGSK
jgi:hypothetical protein